MAFVALSLGLLSLAAKGPPRRVIYTYNQSGLIIIMIVQENETGAKGNVTVIGASKTHPALQDNFYISHAEFEQIWSTLKAPGVEKRPWVNNEYEAEDYYIFDGGGQRWSVKKAQSAPAISALASRLRNHAAVLMKRGMAPLPLTAVTPKPKQR